MCYFTISLQIQYCRGRCLGLAARDAKKQFASRTATLECSYITILLYYYFTLLLFYYFTILLAPDTVLPRPMFGVGRPRCKKKIHVLPRTTKYTTYYHVLQQNVVFASRTATLACRPSYSTVLLFYYFTISLQVQYCRGFGRPKCKKIICISDSHPCMSALLFYYFAILLFYYFTILLFYYFTILLFYYFTPDTVLPRPMFGDGRPRCKQIFFPRTTTYYSRT